MYLSENLEMISRLSIGKSRPAFGEQCGVNKSTVKSMKKMKRQSG
jgi:hypothetical protein